MNFWKKDFNILLRGLTFPIHPFLLLAWDTNMMAFRSHLVNIKIRPIPWGWLKEGRAKRGCDYDDRAQIISPDLHFSGPLSTEREFNFYLTESIITLDLCI